MAIGFYFRHHHVEGKIDSSPFESPEFYAVRTLIWRRLSLVFFSNSSDLLLIANQDLSGRIDRVDSPSNEGNDTWPWRPRPCDLCLIVVSGSESPRNGDRHCGLPLFDMANGRRKFAVAMNDEQKRTSLPLCFGLTSA